jgi:hypothetical protein
VPHPNTDLKYTLVISPTDHSGFWSGGTVTIGGFGIC